MRPENEKMKQYLKENGIECTPKYLFDGSLKKRWRLYNASIKWWDNIELQSKFKELGFTDYDGKEISNYSGNGGMFSVVLYAPIDLTQEIFNTDSFTIPANTVTADALEAQQQSEVNAPQSLTTRSQRRQIRLDKVCRIYGKKVRAGQNIPRYL